MKENQFVLCFDLQKVLPTPYGEHADFYYVSKLSTYNFTCYDLHSKQGFCYVWDETVAKRGASEIGSCMYKHISLNCTTHPETEITCFCDSCPGQNRNRFLLNNKL